MFVGFPDNTLYRNLQTSWFRWSMVANWFFQPKAYATLPENGPNFPSGPEDLFRPGRHVGPAARTAKHQADMRDFMNQLAGTQKV